METINKEYNLEALTKVKDDNNIFKIQESDFDLPLRVKSFLSTKEYECFIKNVEKLVRMCQEYRLWVDYIIDHLGHSCCALTKESINECPVQIHHHPISLYAITKGVVNWFLTKEIEFSTFDVATKVIELHFQDKIGYIVLISDLHAKYHNGFLSLPIELVHGEFKYVLQNYTIDENEYDKICKLCNVHVEDLKLQWKKDDYPGISGYTEEKVLPENEQKRLSA